MNTISNKFLIDIGSYSAASAPLINFFRISIVVFLLYFFLFTLKKRFLKPLRACSIETFSSSRNVLAILPVGREILSHNNVLLFTLKQNNFWSLEPHNFWK